MVPFDLFSPHTSVSSRPQNTQAATHTRTHTHTHV